MLRITLHEDPETVTLVLEGRLITPWIEEVERAWGAVAGARDGNSDGRRLVVDLSGCTSIEERAKHLLRRMHEQGAELRAVNLMTKAIVEEVRSQQPSTQ
jgi:hypothetical protein